MPNPFPIEIAVEPKFRVDQSKLVSALDRLRAEDSSFGVSIDRESGQTILRGRDELHLDTKVDLLKRACDFDIRIGAPQIAYREKLAKCVEIDETYKKLTGGSGQFARVKIIFEPMPFGTGSIFESTVASGTVPKEYIPGVEKGINSVMGSGILAGFPVVDVKATLIDGAFHDVDSSVLAFELCARAAFRRALKEGGSVLLEPIMKVEVTIPEDYLGSVTSDLLSRRGQIQGRESRGNLLIINATVPLSNLFGYVNQLRSFTQGHGTHKMRFDHYAPVVLPPRNDDGRFPPAAGMRASSGRNFEDWKLDLVQSNIVRP